MSDEPGVAALSHLDSGAEIAVVLEYFRRCGNQDPSVVDMYAKDAEFFDCVGPTVTIGRSAIWSNVFEPLFEGLPDFSCNHAIRHLVASQGTVMAELEIRGTHSGLFLGFAPTGHAITWPTTGVWSIDSDGLITREAYYWSLEVVMRQLADERKQSSLG